MYQDLIDKLRAEFPKHHLEIQTWPTGGELTVWACEECGSDETYSAPWRYAGPAYPRRSLDDAVADLKRQIEEAGK